MTTLSVSRRKLLLSAAAAFGSSGLARGSTAPDLDWRLGFRNAPPNGVGPMRLRTVHGRLPQDVAGVLYRNGPAQFTWGPHKLGHWFDGDGFIRAFRLGDGGVQLTARFVDTVKRRTDSTAQAFATPGFGTPGNGAAGLRNSDDTNAANTSVMMVGDRLWALWEAGSPYALDPETLATQGPQTLRPDLAHMPYSAHPKVEPNGRIWNFGLGFGGASAIIWALGKDGALEKAEIVRLPMKSYLHDWAVSRTKLILPLAPWVLERPRLPIADGYAWRPELGMKILVIDKDDFSKQRIYEAPAAFFFHTGDAWEDADGSIRFDVCLSDAPTLDSARGGALARGETPPPIDEPRLALATLRPDGSASVERLSIQAEFPRTDARSQGLGHSRLYFASQSEAPRVGPFGFDSVASMDWRSGTTTRFVYGSDHLVEEHVPIANDWLVGTTLNLKAQSMEIHVLKANRLSDGPVFTASVDAPLPLGFHGTWRPD